MDSHKKTTAQRCLDGAYANTMSFPESVKTLMEAGFEGYHVDYRLNRRTHYLPDGETLALDNPHDADAVGPQFNQPEISAAIKWAQSNSPDYNYVDFNRKVAANGCAGYVVSFPGRRVLYFGRTAETHVEHFPGQP
jgi:uncharacterized protein YbcV (DUF1398 family)